MHLRKIISALCASTVVAGCAPGVMAKNESPKAVKPNFVTIVIDDMGYSDLKMFGGELDTPNLERLAADSVLMSQFYAAPSSSPSRAMLFTGKDNHAAGMGAMKENLREEQKGKPNYEGVMSLSVPPFPALLQQAGYHTMMTGKWHLGGHEKGEEAYYPFNRGFSQTRGLLLPGGDMTFMTGKDGEFITEHPADHLFDGRKSLYNDNGREADLSKLPPFKNAEFYYTDSALAMLSDWSALPQRPPFYLNMAYVAPHQPLQAPKELVDSVVGIYAAGWDKLREQRFENLKRLGLLAADAKLPPRPANVPAWDSLSERQKAFEARRMAVYAAEIKVLDENIGRLVQRLKELGVYDDTVFFVYSDNGASNTSFGHMPKNFTYHEYNADQLAAMSEAEFTKMLGEMGSAYSWLGPNTEWAMVSSVPHRGVKGDTFDGGIVGAAFIHSPGETKGAKYEHCGRSVMDIAPTILAMADVAYPTRFNGKPLAPMDGVSLTGLIAGEPSCDEGRVLAFEVDGVKAVRKGDWKLSQGWNDAKEYLFNLKDDPFERNDLAASNPGKLAELRGLYTEYAARNLVVQVNTQHLPNLVDPARTDARVRGGTSFVDPDGFNFNFKNDAAFGSGAPINVAGEVRPQPADQGKAGSVYAELIARKAGGEAAHYFLTPNGIVAGQAGSKTPFLTVEQLPEMVLLPLFEGTFADLLARLGEGTESVEFVMGYSAREGGSIDNASHGSPMRLAVKQ